MCGIAGIWDIEKKQEQSSNIKFMTEVMKERGPDHAEFEQIDDVWFGHTRLSIIDLNDSANQPFWIDQDFIMVFNGEIYNYKEIRKQLSVRGTDFKTSGDTEVLLHAYKTYGIRKTLELIEGMFAFAIYNRSSRKLILARDRFGQKPLYYCHLDKQLFFSSEIKGMQRILRDKLELDLESVDYFLTELSVPQPKSIWKEISQLRPAHYMEIDMAKPLLKEHAYWNLNFSNKVYRLEEDILEETEEILLQSIQKRTVSDVPIGTFLSGGVDSGLITALLAQNSTEPIKTFTVALDYQDQDESKEAKIVADRYQTDHHELKIDIDIMDTLEDLIEYYGEPFADSSMIPSYAITKEIKKHVTVALSGDGGDEQFGGYWDFLECFKAQEFRTDNWFGPTRALKILVSKGFNKLGWSSSNLGAIDDYYKIPHGFKLYRSMGLSPYDKQHLYTEKLERFAGFTPFHLNKIWNNRQTKELVDQFLHASMDTRLLNDYLVKVDRASMFNSLEVRSPFLDHEIAQFAASIPNDIKFGGNNAKNVLKKLALKHVDPNILNRPKKGFGIPMTKWLKEDLKDVVDDVIYSSSFRDRNLLNVNKTIEMVKLHREGDHDFLTDRIFAIICLELWMRKYL